MSAGKMTNRPTNEISDSPAAGLSGIRIPSTPLKARESADDSAEKTAAQIPLPGLSTEAVFRELRISALLKARCYVTKAGLVRIQLELSEYPPLGWSYIFLTAWRSMDYPTKALVGIDEDTLWIECEAAEFKDRHFPELQKAIDEANSRYRTVLQEQIAAEEKRERIDRETLERYSISISG